MKLWQHVFAGIGILLLACAIAPLIYHVTSYSFERILSRLIMGLGLLYLLKNLHIQPSVWKGLRESWTQQTQALFIRCFALGFVTLLLLSFTSMAFGGRAWNPNWKGPFDLALHLLEYLASCLVIGGLEEIFFRRFLFHSLLKKRSLIMSLVLTNVIYATLHFLKKGGYEVPTDPGFFESLKVMASLGSDFLDPIKLAPHFLGLFLFGLILSFAYLRSGSLWASVGLHAGTVYFLKVDKYFVASEGRQMNNLIFGDRNLHSGVLCWFFMGLLFLALWKILPRSE